MDFSRRGWQCIETGGSYGYCQTVIVGQEPAAAGVPKSTTGLDAAKKTPGRRRGLADRHSHRHTDHHRYGVGDAECLVDQRLRVSARGPSHYADAPERCPIYPHDLP